MFKKEVNLKNGGDVESSSTQTPVIERRLNRIKELIAEAEKAYDKYLVNKNKPEVIVEPSPIANTPRVRRGRATKRDVIDVNAATA